MVHNFYPFLVLLEATWSLYLLKINKEIIAATKPASKPDAIESISSSITPPYYFSEACFNISNTCVLLHLLAAANNAGHNLGS
jgi:hypothetical protein